MLLNSEQANTADVRARSSVGTRRVNRLSNAAVETSTRASTARATPAVVAVARRSVAVTANAPSDVRASSAADVEKTTDMLLEIRNMSEKEITEVYRDVRGEEQVKQYCKKYLFHCLKFIVNKSDLSRLSSPTDIGNVVMKGLNIVDGSVKARWWLLYQDVVRKTIII